MTVELSWPATPRGSGSVTVRSQITSVMMNTAAMLRLATTISALAGTV